MRELREVFPGRLRKVWNSMELRVLVLLSLFLQIVLISTGSRRKYIRKKWAGVILWLCYLSADVVATVALGVLSRAAGDDLDGKSVDQHSYAIMGFWAPFLLMHLGGPDSITAYAMADNELWSRHFLGLIGQVSIALYVLLRSWISTPINYLWFAIFAAGFLKYGERTMVLYWASRDRFRKWMVSPPDPGPNYAKFMDELVYREREGFDVSLGEVVIDIDSSSTLSPDVVQGGVGVQDAYPFFLTFKQLFADLILSFQDKETSLSFFRALTWENAFGVVEIELGLIYDLFYTKALLLYFPHGLLIRVLTWLSTVAGFIVFIIIDKSAYPKTEVIITYILLVGAILIEMYAVMILLLSDWDIIWPQLPVAKSMSTIFLESIILIESDTLRDETISEIIILALMPCIIFSIKFFVRILSWLRFLFPARFRWSNAMGQDNVLDRCIESEPHKICKYWKKYLCWNGISVPDSLKKLMFNELKRRVESIDENEKLGEYRGDKVLLKQIARIKKIDGVEFDPNVDEVEFDQSVLLWHMATDFCYHSEVDEHNKPVRTWLYEESCSQNILQYRRETSLLLSNYMVHLLITSPFMLPSGIGQIRFQDTRAEAKEFFDGQENISRREACKRLLKVDTRLAPSKVKGDRSKSLLFDACRLAQSLRSLEVGERWEIISQAWLHILTFAAAQCEWNDHAEKLSQGGELLTHVWLLMAHFGMTDHFQISQGYQRVKLDLK